MPSCKIVGNSKVVDNLLSVASGLDKSGKSGFILSSMKSVLSIMDRIYISKFEKFWLAIEENEVEKDEFIRRTEEKQDFQKVGENFLLVMDGFAAFDKCYYYGKIWISWLKEEINTNEFIEITDILQNIFITDLHEILYRSEGENFKNSDRLYNCGFLERREVSIPYPAQRRNKNGNKMLIMSDVDKDFSKIRSYVSNLITHISDPYVITKSGKKLIEILTKK